jgi:signal transduction histidine kinase
LHSAKEAAESALLAKSRFLASTGHDLRQATHAMNLLLAAVSEELSSRPAEQDGLTSLTDEIGKLVASMSEQLSGLLEMARLESGTVVPVIRECVLGDVLERTASRFSRFAQTNDVDFRVIGSSLRIETDPHLLDRVVGNVIHNAIKFGSGGRVLVGCRRRANGCSVQVWDEGVGIPSDKVAEIFGEYRQLETSVKQAGLGLGLAIASRNAAILGYALKAWPQPRGACFSVEIEACRVRRT